MAEQIQQPKPELLTRLTYSVAEVAHLLGISRAQAYNCVNTGVIPSIALGGRKVIPRQAIRDMLAGAGGSDGQAA